MQNEVKSAFGEKKIIIWLAVVVILAAGIIGGVYYKKSHGATKEVSSENQAPASKPQEINLGIVEYDGVNDVNVLELLKDKTKVEFSNSEFGAFVTSINGIKGSDKESWLYSVNGVDGAVASDKYITKSGDKIKWELKGF